jgi:hypothetical protein
MCKKKLKERELQNLTGESPLDGEKGAEKCADKRFLPTHY